MLTTPKMAYLQPVCTFVNVQAESHILTISGSTTDPVEGGDPTGGNGMDLLQTHSQVVLLILRRSKISLMHQKITKELIYND